MVASDAVGHLTVYAFLLATLAAGPLLQAPVYVMVSDSVMRRHGTFSYTSGDEGYQVLFCIATPPQVVLRCAVRTPLDLLVIIEAQATEQDT